MPSSTCGSCAGRRCRPSHAAGGHRPPFIAGRDADIHLLDTRRGARRRATSVRSRCCCGTRTATMARHRCTRRRRPPGDAREDECTPPAFGCGLAGSGFYDRHFRPDVGAAVHRAGRLRRRPRTHRQRLLLPADRRRPRRAHPARPQRPRRLRLGHHDHRLAPTSTPTPTATARPTSSPTASSTSSSGPATCGPARSSRPTDDVTLSSPRRILDAESGTGVARHRPDDPTDVGGVNIDDARRQRSARSPDLRLHRAAASQGGIGAARRLPRDRLRPQRRPRHGHRHAAGDGHRGHRSRTTLGIFITEMVGDLNVELVHTLLGDVSLATGGRHRFDRRRQRRRRRRT